jgi:hypothetical protein
MHILPIPIKIYAPCWQGWVPQRLYCYTPESLADTLLFPMDYVHPPNRFELTDLAKIDLGGFQILMF